METIQVTRYKCSTCGKVYDNKTGATSCESAPVSQDKGAKVGDRVRVTLGDGAGGLAIVESVYVIDREWGHYAWKRYWHTVALTAKLVDDVGSRMLTFDSYELV